MPPSTWSTVGLSSARDVLLGVFFVAWMTWSVWLLVLLRRRAQPFRLEAHG